MLIDSVWDSLVAANHRAEQIGCKGRFCVSVQAFDVHSLNEGDKHSG